MGVLFRVVIELLRCFTQPLHDAFYAVVHLGLLLDEVEREVAMLDYQDAGIFHQ
jgi:hypothetical protein